MGFFSGLWSWASGSNIASSLAKTALLVYASKLLGGNTDPGSSGTTAEPDKGVRLQLDPSTDNQIPVLYGEAYFGGNITDAVLSADYKKMTYCLVLAELTGEKLSTSGPTGYAFKGVYLNNNRVVFKADGFTVDYTLDSSGNQDVSYRDLIKIYCYIDNPLQPQGYSGTTPESYTVMPGWNSTDYPMTDLCYAIVEVTYNKDKNVTGLPDCIFHMDTNMKKPGDVLVDYMISTTYGAGIPVTEIDASFIDLNTYADAGFTYTNTLGQSVTSAITINGLIDTTQPVLDNMKKLADAANAWISYNTTAGKWVVVINKAGTSVASFTDSNIIGDISISGTSLTQLNSAANVKYQNTDILDKTDFVKIEIPSGDLYDYESDFGKTIEINLPYTNSQVVAAKVGLVQLKQGRIDKIIKFKGDYSYIELRAGDLIDVTSSVYGFTNKVFRIITIAEAFDDDGILSMDITALEYDADVYNYNITEYEVETDGGILGIGSIGKPNTPTVTKTEQSNSPRIVINGLVPSGIVDAVEFWITFDTGVSEANRNYIQIGRYTSTSGVSLTEDDAVSYTYSGLSQSDFYVKIRGVNSITSGPFSDPSGLIAYVPIVVADTLSDAPVSVGGQLMGLGLLTLLNNLDKLFGGDTTAGGLFDKIFKLFEEETGTDLVAQTTQKVTEIPVYQDGLLVDGFIKTLKFTGAGVEVDTDVESNITINISGGDGGGGGGTVTAINDLSDVDTVTITPTTGDRLIWDGTNWVPDQQGTGSLPDPGGEGSSECTFGFSAVWPPDEATASDSYAENSYVNGYSSDKAPIDGSYYIRFSDGYGSQFSKGSSGNVRLYKSNGTLVETIGIGGITIDKDTVRLAFAQRQRGTDYYITMDAGMVVSPYGCKNAEIKPKDWNFNTPWEEIAIYNIAGTTPTVPAECGEIFLRDFQVRSLFTEASIYIDGNLVPQYDKTRANRQSDLYFRFNIPVVLNGDGYVDIFNSSGSLIQRIDGVEAAVASPPAGSESDLLYTTGVILRVDPTVDLTPGTTYYVVVGPNTIKSTCGPGFKWGGGGGAGNTTFTVDPGPTAGSAGLPSSGSINEAPIAMTFDRPVVAGSGNLVVYDANNNVVATVASNDAAITYTQGV